MVVPQFAHNGVAVGSIGLSRGTLMVVDAHVSGSQMLLSLLT